MILNQIEPNWTKLNQIEPNWTKLNQKERRRMVWLNQIEPNQTKSNQIKRNRTKSNQIEQKATQLNEIEAHMPRFHQIEHSSTTMRSNEAQLGVAKYRFPRYGLILCTCSTLAFFILFIPAVVDNSIALVMFMIPIVKNPE